MATFKESIAAMRAALKRGDITAIAAATGYSYVTVRKLFFRDIELAVELTEAEREIIKYCNGYFEPRFKAANEIERSTMRTVAKADDDDDENIM